MENQVVETLDELIELRCECFVFKVGNSVIARSIHEIHTPHFPGDLDCACCGCTGHECKDTPRALANMEQFLIAGMLEDGDLDPNRNREESIVWVGKKGSASLAKRVDEANAVWLAFNAFPEYPRSSWYL
jgi:hypothetical protein